MKVRVGHPGARMYYGIPRALQSIGALEKLYTDFTVNKGLPSLLSHVPVFRSMKNRYASGIRSRQIVHLPDYGLRTRLKIRKASSELEINELNLKQGFALEKKMMQDDLRGVDAVTMVGSSAQHVFKLARQKNIRTISEQIIAPAGAYIKVIDDYLLPYLDWEELTTTRSSLNFWQEVSYKEWEHTDYLLCGSEFVQNAVMQLGFEKSKTVVIPYGVPLTIKKPVDKQYNPNKRKLRVLFVGTVCIRKGVQYLLEIAKALSAFCEIKICGGISLKKEVIDNYKNDVSFEGHISRDELARYYEWADVFVLPTLFEGSATVCYEAIQFGLPIVTTKSSGIVLQQDEGMSLVREGSKEELYSALLRYHTHPELLERHQLELIKKIEYASLPYYQQRLQHFFRSIDK